MLHYTRQNTGFKSVHAYMGAICNIGTLTPSLFDPYECRFIIQHRNATCEAMKRPFTWIIALVSPDIEAAEGRVFPKSRE